jgi:hypothetical protein
MAALRVKAADRAGGEPEGRDGEGRDGERGAAHKA